MANSTGGDAAVYLWRFANVEFDERTFELRVGGIPVEVERAPLRVLRALLDPPGQLVSREALLETVWKRPEHLISKTVLTNAIGKLRRALADESQKIIVTVGGAYQLGVDVERTELPALPSLDRVLRAGQPAPHRPHWLLRDRIDATGSSEVWRVEHEKTGDVRVFKFAGDGFQIAALKREVTISRLMREVLGDRLEFIRIHDWNFDQPPYFIESDYGGDDLLKWAERRGGLPTIPMAERLEVMIQLANAVAVAHSVGILHKDLKPANVLAHTDKQGKLTIKVLDFGSGRLLEPEVLDDFGITRHPLPDADPITGTPLYIAPEILAGDPPTIQSDIYALGVMLYQLVIGDFKRPIASGWEGQINDVLLRTDIAASTQGDIKERLTSATELATRIQTLDARHETLQAAELQSATDAQIRAAFERARSRRPWLAAIIGILIIGLAATGTLYFRAEASRKLAKDQLDSAAAINRYMRENIFAAANPMRGGNKDITVLDALHNSQDSVDVKFADHPRLNGEVHHSLAITYDQLRDFPRSEEEFKKAIALLSSSVGPSAPDTVVPKIEYSVVLAEQTKFGDASNSLDEIEKTATELLEIPAIGTRFYNAKGAIAVQTQRADDAVIAYEKASVLADKATTIDRNQVNSLKINLGYAYLRAAKAEKASKLLDVLVKDLSSHEGTDAPITLRAKVILVASYVSSGQYEIAAEQSKVLRKDIVRVLGADHAFVNDTYSSEADSYFYLGRFKEAAATYLEAVNRAMKLNGAEQTSVVDALIGAGLSQQRDGQLAEAVATLKRAKDIAVKIFGKESGQSGALDFFIADVLIKRRSDLDEAQQLIAGVDQEKANTAYSTECWPYLLKIEGGLLADARGDHDAALKILSSAKLADVTNDNFFKWRFQEAAEKLKQLESVT